MPFTAETRPTSTIIYDSVDQQQAAYNNASTWLAETLPGSLRTSFEFSFDGHELYGQDGSPLAPVFRNAIIDAEAIAEQRPNLVFELRRRYIEAEEYDDMLAMARGEAPNTTVVVSDFPHELQTAAQDVGGYNVARKQTMLRVINRQNDGSIKITTQSLDLSDRPALEAIYGYFNIWPQQGELLGQRIHDDIDGQEQPYLIDRLMGIYDRQLTENYGGSWFAGRASDHAPDTYDFVKQQHDLLALFVGSLLTDKTAAEKMRYDVAATMAKRLSLLQIIESPATLPYMQTIPLEQEIAQNGAEARARGLGFSGCGGTVGVETGDQLKQSGYGSKTNESTTYSFDKKMYCVVCQAPPSKAEKPKMCGPCGICKACDFRLKTKTKAA